MLLAALMVHLTCTRDGLNNSSPAVVRHQMLDAPQDAAVVVHVLPAKPAVRSDRQGHCEPLFSDAAGQAERGREKKVKKETGQQKAKHR